MSLRPGVAAVVLTLVLGAAGPAVANKARSFRGPTVGRAPTGFLAGAGAASTTPPLVGTPQAQQVDRQFGSRGSCLAAAYPGEGRFALQEPFADLGHTGAYALSDPFCDANGNGRWDGIYTDKGTGPASGIHDPIGVRAFAVSDGHHEPVVYASVDQIGLFDYYTEQARYALAHTYHVAAALVVSANHNESSPDSIGLYGGLQTPLGVGLRSGIDEYYMRFLEDRIASAAAQAVHNLRPARLYATQIHGRGPDGVSGGAYPLLSGLSQRISDQFPTSVALPGDNRVAAVDIKLGVLQAQSLGRRPRPIFTVMSLAAHNQEMGNSGAGLSADWPGAFEHAFDATHFGLAVFLVGDNGSEEDPQTNPTVIPKGSENHSSQATQYIQAQATGSRFAHLVAAATRREQLLRPGAVTLTRRQLCVPLENNGFVSLAAAGVFGLRQGYTCDARGNPVAPVPNGGLTPTASTEFRTFVGYADLGPDLQLMDVPGEAFPALMLGSPFGVQDQSCPRPNPPVPTWHARALYRFQVGLADDLIGYLIPAWGFASGTPGLFSGDSCYQDMHGHRHKLESESVGPTGSNDVASALSALLASEPDPAAHIVTGRFLQRDGTLSRWPTGAVGLLIARPGTTSIGAQSGRLLGAPTTAGVGARAVDASAVFMDYDGQPQPAPDLSTRGMMLLRADGCVAARYYLNVFPSLQTNQPLGRRMSEPAVRPARACHADQLAGVPELQPLAAEAAGLRGLKCTARSRPPRVWVTRRGAVLRGRARAGSCARVARVSVSLRGRPPLLAHGTIHWRLALSGALGGVVRVVDTNGRSATARVR